MVDIPVVSNTEEQKHFFAPYNLLYGIDALLAIEEASLQVEAGEGGGPISVFTGSCLLSGLETIINKFIFY